MGFDSSTSEIVALVSALETVEITDHGPADDRRHRGALERRTSRQRWIGNEGGGKQLRKKWASRIRAVLMDRTERGMYGGK